MGIVHGGEQGERDEPVSVGRALENPRCTSAFCPFDLHPLRHEPERRQWSGQRYTRLYGLLSGATHQPLPLSSRTRTVVLPGLRPSPGGEPGPLSHKPPERLLCRRPPFPVCAAREGGPAAFTFQMLFSRRFCRMIGGRADIRASPCPSVVDRIEDGDGCRLSGQSPASEAPRTRSHLV